MGENARWPYERATINAVLAWSELQPADVSLVFRAILAAMAQSGGTAACLSDRIALTFADAARFFPERDPSPPSLARFTEIMQQLKIVDVLPESIGRLGLRLRRGALLDITKASSTRDPGCADVHWLVAGGHWALIHLSPDARDALCRIAWASLLPDSRSGALTRTVALAALDASYRAGAGARDLALLGLSPDAGAALGCLEKTEFLEELVLEKRGQPSGWDARFSLRRRPAD